MNSGLGTIRGCIHRYTFHPSYQLTFDVYLYIANTLTKLHRKVFALQLTRFNASFEGLHVIPTEIDL